MNDLRRSGDMDSFAILRARELLNNTGAVPAGVLPPVIELSWQRCLNYGLSDGQGVETDLLRRDQLADQLEKNRLLVSHAKPVMDVLLEQIVDTQNVVVLANDAGCILHSCGDADFQRRARSLALVPGAEWCETLRGTNALGTAVAEGVPVVVHGDQHFMSVNNSLTCSASPILDPQGRLSGVLDVTGDHRSFNSHTMALVRMSVQMIENKMFASAFSEVLTLRFHSRPEFVGTLCEGMAAFSEDGMLLSANRNACFQLSETLESLRGRSFSSIFGQPLARVFDHLMVRPQDPLALTLGNGVSVQARAEFGAANLRRKTHFMGGYANADGSSIVAHAGNTAKAPMAPVANKAAELSSCPLARLQTGDAQVDAVVGKVRKVVGRDIPILIHGETGTGKELLASAIHAVSPRAGKPFIAVNCAAIPEGLIESELFGYEEGAFTGARRKGSVGRILQADGGTLFLDEIGDMPLPLQARLLRVLQERVVTPLGSMKSYPVNIAVICATHRRIRELVKDGRFREDLYFRLNGLTVMLPPLRARSDLEPLVARMIRELGGASAPSLDPEVLKLFRSHPWPGNIRQLSNLLRTALVMAEGEDKIYRHHLADDFLDDVDMAERTYQSSGVMADTSQTGDFVHEGLSRGVFPASTFTPDALRDTGKIDVSAGRLQDVALLAIRDAISRHHGNISAAARELGISRNTLYRKLQPS
jgi:transcriptional regulator of acetoin/glycerol metabolism